MEPSLSRNWLHKMLAGAALMLICFPAHADSHVFVPIAALLVGESDAIPQGQQRFILAEYGFSIDFLPVDEAKMTPDCTGYIVLSKRGKEMARLSTIGYIDSVYWSPDGKYVALTNRRGESGDYLWVISTDRGSIVHKPDDDLEIRDGTKSFPEYEHLELHKEWILPRGWASNNHLLVRVDDIYSGANDYLRIDAEYLVESGALHLKSQTAKKLPRP